MTDLSSTQPHTSAAGDESAATNAGPDAAMIRAAWVRHGLMFGALMLAQAIIYFESWQSLVDIWSGSATFNHCFLILPIVGWLVWQRREIFSQVMPQVSIIGALLLLGPALLWSLGHLAGIKLFEHVAIVGSLQVSVLAAFGWRGLKALLFPVAYLVFLAPIGDQLTKPLQDMTAQFSVWSLLQLGIPTYSDGVFIQIPTGDFEVAEACAGVRFLIATIALGVLYANIAFKSWPRRIIVMLLCIVVPICANAIRALGIILIAHYSNAKYAVGVDHLVYGWGFFAFVTVILILIGQRFADRPLTDPLFDAAPLAREGGKPVALPALAVAFGCALAVLVASWLINTYIDTRTPDRVVQAIVAPEVPGWRLVEVRELDWQPEYREVDARKHFVYVSGTARIDVAVVALNRETRERELIAHGQGAVPSQSEDPTISQWRWMMSIPGPQVDGKPLPTQAMMIRRGGLIRDVWQWYLVGDRIGGSASRAKVDGLIAKATGGDLLTATLFVSGIRQDSYADARPQMQAFLTAAGGPDKLLRSALKLSAGEE